MKNGHSNAILTYFVGVHQGTSTQNFKLNHDNNNENTADHGHGIRWSHTSSLNVTKFNPTKPEISFSLTSH